jgi:hypothetical protein
VSTTPVVHLLPVSVSPAVDNDSNIRLSTPKTGTVWQKINL